MTKKSLQARLASYGDLPSGKRYFVEDFERKLA